MQPIKYYTIKQNTLSPGPQHLKEAWVPFWYRDRPSNYGLPIIKVTL